MNQWVFCFATTVTTKRNPSVPLRRPQYLQWNSSSRVCVCDASSSSAARRMGGREERSLSGRGKGGRGRDWALLGRRRRRSLTPSSSSSCRQTRSKPYAGGRIWAGGGGGGGVEAYTWLLRSRMGRTRPLLPTFGGRDETRPLPLPLLIAFPSHTWMGGGGGGGRRGRQRNRETQELKSKEVTCTMT